jgi:hypothetical protein
LLISNGMRKLIYIIIAAVLLASGNEASAQMNRRSIKKNNKRISSYRGRKSIFSKEKRYNAVGFSLSALNYYGDLSPRPNRFSTDISFTRPALGISFTHRFGPFYSITGNFMYGTLKGSDSESASRGDTDNGVFRYQRNLSFRNRIKELSVVATFDLFENQSTYISRVKWTPYAFIGIAGFFHNPQAKAPATDLQGNPLPQAGEWVNLQPLGTEGQFADLADTDVNSGIKKYRKFQPAIPFGIGVRLRVNEVIDVAFEIGFRYTFTDYLDDVSQNYVDLGVFGNDELARAMSYRSGETGIPATRTYVGRDGVTYNTILGYGEEYKDNMRGSKNDRDIYMVTTLKATYILGKTFHRAKFR